MNFVQLAQELAGDGGACRNPVVPGAGSPHLAEFDVAFCDSREALTHAYAQGLPQNAEIWSTAPALLLAGLPHVRALEKRLRPEKICAFNEGCDAFILKAYRSVASRPAIASLALSVARAMSALQPMILRAGMLRSEDFSSPRVLLEARTGHKRFDERLVGPLPLLLDGNRAAIRFAFDVTLTAERSAFGESQASLVSRLSLGGVEKILYKAALQLWRFFPAWLSRGTIWTRTDSELVRDTAVALALRGFAIKRLRSVPTPDRVTSVEVLAALDAAIVPVFRDRILSVATEQAIDPLLRRLLAQLRPALAWHAGGVDCWLKQLDRTTAAVLVNYPIEGIDEMLALAARARRVPLVTFQHGIGLEIGANYAQLHCQYENTIGDLCIVNNPASQQCSTANPYAFEGNRIAIAGLSSEHCAAQRVRRRSGKAPPILYVSTALYRGNVQRRIDPLTDEDLALFEREIVNTCLARLPHRVAYKPYPSLRYPDADPVLAAIAAAPNISVTGAFTDLRYVLGAHRIIVASRATSTLSWCLLTDRPVIYIDTDDFYRLRPDAAAAFRAGTIYFDAAAPGWLEGLHAFLSQPIEVMEAVARQKTGARRELERRYFTPSRTGAGRRAGSAILRRRTELRTAGFAIDAASVPLCSP